MSFLSREYEILLHSMQALRHGVSRSQWDSLASPIVQYRHQLEAHLRKAETEIDRSLGSVEEFRRTGLAILPAVRPAVVAALRSYFEQLPVIESEIAPHNIPRSLEELRNTSHFAIHPRDQVLCAPGLVDLINTPAIIDFVEAYLGCVPTLYSVRAWWSFPATSPEGPQAEFFHRDIDDWRFCTLFLYLTDVTMSGGPHQLIPESHTLAGMEKLIAHAREQGRSRNDFTALKSFDRDLTPEFSDKCSYLFHDRIASVTGAAGSMFIANTLALHRGLFPSMSPRLMVWARFGLGPNSNADGWTNPLARKLVPSALPDTERNRYINRLQFQ
jgi:hypothetical protein